jgi:hypothetical protein
VAEDLSYRTKDTAALVYQEGHSFALGPSGSKVEDPKVVIPHPRLPPDVEDA